MAFVAFGLAAVAPPGIKGFIGFLQAPPGLAVVALALMAVGLTIEEMGTMRRIRLGIGMRLASLVVLVAAVVWALLLGAPMPSLAMIGFVIGGAGALGVGIAFAHDWATYADVRHGQTTRLLELARSGLEIESQGARFNIGMGDILAVRIVQNFDGRAVIFLVNTEARNRKDLDALPWIGATPEGDALALTEHQAGMDVEQLVTQIVEFTAAGRRESTR